MRTTARQLLVTTLVFALALALQLSGVSGICGAIEPAFAQDGAPAAKPAAGKAPKRTSINFEDQLVEGQTQKPELFYLLQQRNNNYKRLIRLRENFLPEMKKTAEDVTR